ncbi:MAG: hypothetical protein WDZ80_04220 [Candidatus Paceibacterota bacterium]
MTIVKAHFKSTNLKNHSLKLGWFIISKHWVEQIRDQRNLYGKWCRIKDLETEKIVYRIISFSPMLKKNVDENTNGIILDWAARVELSNFHGNEDRYYHLEISRSNWLQAIKAAWIHPDPNQKLFFRIGVTLGAISTFLGILSIILALN